MQNKKQNFYCGFWNYTFCGALDAKKAAKDWKELGMNLGMSSIYNEKDDKQVILDQLNEAQKNGVKLIICDWRTVWRNCKTAERNIFVLRKKRSRISETPAFYAFSVGDEAAAARTRTGDRSSENHQCALERVSEFFADGRRTVCFGLSFKGKTRI